ncbi:PsbP-related protein [Candidatus Nitrosocosmicus agrestis]|uniref:PsbP-related protein n=1 Tax=Candidatus Nitrosocosmicus agrestis TaxID=2563600 RepID=UPI00122EA102|nr:PsbP-related protein [Candidatus Nitrosocosmicus sp. SS]KAA2279853.1 hypothetical protein F1Z66_12370 [Candidatus Nitrosocosmicus sp. SS]KAF0870381.1 hypothetical protein E5N71_00645 [Candidatus Nitrosocosmicus sp. SS]
MTKISFTINSFLIITSIFVLYFTILPAHQNVAFSFFHESQTQAMLTYTDNKFHYEVKYPNNWEKSVKLNDEVIFIAPKETDSVSSPAGFVVKVVPTPGKNVSSIAATNTLISQIKSAHKDFKQESVTPTVLDGKKATQVVFTATDSKLQNRKAMQTVVSNFENIYVLTYKASTDKYGSFENVAKDIVNSFKFVPN